MCLDVCVEGLVFTCYAASECCYVAMGHCSGCTIVKKGTGKDVRCGAASCNYMYIPDFGRYYYISDIIADTGGAAIVTGEVDVLMTYAAAIKQAPAVVVRSTSSTNTGSQKSTWIPDPQLPMTTGRTVKAVILEGSDLNIDTATMTSNNFVLNVAGGGAIT